MMTRLLEYIVSPKGMLVFCILLFYVFGHYFLGNSEQDLASFFVGTLIAIVFIQSELKTLKERLEGPNLIGLH